MKTNGTAVITQKGTTSGTQNDDGTFTPDPGSGVERWSGRAMLLDEGPMVQVTGGWQLEYDADAEMFVPRGTVGRAEIVEGDVITFTYDDGDVVSGEIKKAIRFKDCLYLRRL